MIFVFQALNKPIVNNTQACNEQKLENVKNCLKQWHSCLHVAIFWRKKKKKSCLIQQCHSLRTNQYCKQYLHLQKIKVQVCSETLSVVCTHNVSLTCHTWSTTKMAGSQFCSVCWNSRPSLKCMAQLMFCYGHSIQQLFNMFYQKGCMLCNAQHTYCSVNCCPTFNLQLSCYPQHTGC